MRLPGFKRKNEDFVRLVREAIPDKRTKIIVACIWGGSLVREPPKNRGLTDDTKGAGSLPGAFELYQDGYENLYHLYGGVNQYYQDCAFDENLPEGEGVWPAIVPAGVYDAMHGRTPDERRAAVEFDFSESNLQAFVARNPVASTVIFDRTLNNWARGAASHTAPPRLIVT